MRRRNKLSRTVRALPVAVALVVCLAPIEAQTYKATVVEQVGQVSVQAGGYLVALSQGGSISPQQVIVAGPDGYAKFQVSDGSTFEVFNNSRVVFRQNLGNWKDLLNVVIGRVKVFIQHEPGKPNYNEVSSPTAVISVRGTVFDVVVEDIDGTTFVTLDEGVVNVRNVTAPGNQVQLLPGDSIRVFRGQPLMGRQIDKGNALRLALKAARDAIWEAMMQRRAGSGPIAGSSPTQADKNKGGTTTTPGAPPAPPGSPPPPPGGGQ